MLARPAVTHLYQIKLDWEIKFDYLTTSSQKTLSHQTTIEQFRILNLA